MYGIVVTFIVIISVLLILVVLAQNPKGGGLSSQFGGAATSQLMGVKKTGDLLEKLTWGFAVSLLLLSVGANFVQPVQEDNILTSPNIENAQAPAALPPELQPADASDLDGLTAEPAPADSTN